MVAERAMLQSFFQGVAHKCMCKSVNNNIKIVNDKSNVILLSRLMYK